MSDSHPDSEKPQEKPSSAGSQLLPLVPSLPTPQEGTATVTSMENTSQGGQGQIQAHSSTNSPVLDYQMVDTTVQNNPQPEILCKKQILPLDLNMSDSHPDFEKREETSSSAVSLLLGLAQSSPTPQQGTATVTSMENTSQGGQGQIQVHSSTNSAITDSTILDRTGPSNPQPAIHPRKRKLTLDLNMSDSHPDFEKREETSSSAGRKFLFLVPSLPTPQQGTPTVTSMANTSQGGQGQIQVRSSTNSAITDSNFMMDTTGQSNPQPAVHPTKRKLPQDLSMSDSLPDFEKPEETSSSAGRKFLFLVPSLPTPQQGTPTVTSMANTSQGGQGQIQVRSSTNSAITDSNFKMDRTGQSNPQPAVHPTKRKLPQDLNMSDSHPDFEKREETSSSAVSLLLGLAQSSPTPQQGTATVTSMENTRQGGQGQIQVHSSTNSAITDSTMLDRTGPSNPQPAIHPRKRKLTLDLNMSDSHPDFEKREETSSSAGRKFLFLVPSLPTPQQGIPTVTSMANTSQGGQGQIQVRSSTNSAITDSNFMMDTTGQSNPQPAVHPTKRKLPQDLSMSDSHPDFEKPEETSSSAVRMFLFYVPSLRTPQQGTPTVTSMANTSQGGQGQIQVRSSTNSAITDSNFKMDRTGQSNPQPAVHPTKRKLPQDLSMSDSHPDSEKPEETSSSGGRMFLFLVPSSPTPQLGTPTVTSMANTSQGGQGQIQVRSSTNSAITDSNFMMDTTGQSNPQPAVHPTKRKLPLEFTIDEPEPSTSTSQCKALPSKLPESPAGVAKVLHRIEELRKDGLWALDTLPKGRELPRPKVHWDFVLEEMDWLAADFERERKCKKAAAKKCARSVEKFFQEKEALAQKAIKSEEMQLKRIASFAAGEVKQFWNNAEKLVAYKLQNRLEEKKQEALDQHLNFIVSQTEKYSSLVAESMNTSQVPSGGKNESHSDVEFEAQEPSEDDEGTIMEQEVVEGTVDHKQEIDILKEEANMSIEDLMAKYGLQPPVTKDTLPWIGDSNSEDEDLSEDATASENEKEEDSALKTLLNDNNDANRDVTKVPSLLRHSLREYQHVGLNWLVTMYKKGLNGILADEMGLGKTIQTIALLAHLAYEEGNWGPHLIVVPTSVILNWELEILKWCPSFKVLTYYGSPKERKLQRSGWTRPYAFHICITSYRLVIQDHRSFRRQKWKYLILDEAQNIKNMKSQRWQLMLNFQTQRRLLLTGTPLQNNLMELWALLHFLMPNLFESHGEFKEWFSNPVTGMLEGSSEYNKHIIKRLHKVLRPFLLRRLKSEVETQMPNKYEHIVMCRLSNRQRYLYDDFMSRTKTKETLASGNYLSVINVLMQLRKVCNHPNLFEDRPTVSPFQMEALDYHVPSLVWSALDYDPFRHVALEYLNLRIVEYELWLLQYVAYRARKLKLPPEVICGVDSAPPEPIPCPKGRVKMNVEHIVLPKAIQVSNQGSPVVSMTNEGPSLNIPLPKVGTSLLGQNDPGLVTPGRSKDAARLLLQLAQSVNTPSGCQLVLSPQPVFTPDPTVTPVHQLNSTRPIMRVPQPNISTTAASMQNCVTTTTTLSNNWQNSSTEVPTTNGSLSACVNSLSSPKTIVTSLRSVTTSKETRSTSRIELKDDELEERRKKRQKEKLESIARINETRCLAQPIYGHDLISSLTLNKVQTKQDWRGTGFVHCRMSNTDDRKLYWKQTLALSLAVHSVEERVAQLADIFSRFVLFVPPVASQPVRLCVPHPPPSKVASENDQLSLIETWLRPRLRLLHTISSAMSTQFPDRRLIQYDCGKLQSLDRLLRRLKADHHRVLIFTQMSRMLDVLEVFLNFHGHIYLRLDGTTNTTKRQFLLERFNADKRIFCFILSTRSGGVGINLTGADTVIFYDSDWNPTMDAQAQDRCHRIGQTRDVHIYRLISEKTIEENILKKANQKRMLGDIAIEGGKFTTAYFKSSTIQGLFNVDLSENDASRRMAEVLHKYDRPPQINQDEIQDTSQDKNALGALENAFAQVEDEADVAAAKVAKAEAAASLEEFDENMLIDHEGGSATEKSKAEIELDQIMEQLNGVEKYAMKFIEETEGILKKRYAAAEAELEQQKKEWEAARLAAVRNESETAEGVKKRERT